MSFDVPPCKILAWYDDADTLVVKATNAWVDCVTHMSYPIDLSFWSEASVARILKYVAKGFDAALPGRDALGSAHSIYSAASLFEVEDRIGSLRTERPTYADVTPYMDGRLASDYGVLLKLKNRMVHAMRYYMKKGLAWLRGERVAEPREPVWIPCDPDDRLNNITRPARPL